ncbi:MAG: hypothetical protein IJX39_09550 [Clostridia bacterium]|nr:hypothetical protein [Clostridia bacterium]
MKNKTIDVPQVRKAMEELLDWQRASRDFLARMADEEAFYRLRVMPKGRQNSEGEVFAPTSAWLLNTILQKHADLMENMPAATCLAREPGDEADAKALSAILPVILERSNFEEAYSENMWCKLKHGVCAFGVFWNGALENGLGDIDIRRVDLRNLYWQPGVRDIQQSRSVYYVEWEDAAALRSRFPQYDGRGTSAEFPGLLPAANGDTEQVPVVDWYYKKRTPTGRTVLHYCKFTGDCVLFATENEEGYENGWYEHGEYPFVLDVLYPIADSCLGFGIIALGRDPQLYIDRMDRNLLEYMDWATRVRFFCKKNTGVNEQEFSDLSHRIVEVEGDPDEERLRQICVNDLDPFWLELKNAKIDELKQTTSSRDVLQGAADGGVVAASAIAALQEAGNKTVRDMVFASYRAFVRTVRLVIECVRQFYSEARYFRILGENGDYRYLSFSNERIAERVTGTLTDGTPVSRRPIFDIDVRAEKKDPYTRLSHNETMKDLYRMGVFKPENAAEASILLSGMDFSGVGRVREQVAALARSHESVSDTASKEAAKGEAAAADPLAVAQAEARQIREAAAGQVAV